MALPSEMTQASAIIQDELDWFEDQDYTGLSNGERRSLLANHLVMCLDTADFDVTNKPERTDVAND